MVNQPNAMLIVEKGLSSDEPIFLEKEDLILGNSSSSDIPLNNLFVSRRHCRIRLKDGQFYVSDLGSKNGTFVNGDLIGEDEERLLNSGDLLGLSAESVKLRFRGSSSEAVTQTLTSARDTGEVRIEKGSREVWVRGEKLEPPLTPKEFDVLALLHSRRTEVVTKDDIAFGGWPERDGDVGNQEIEQCIRRIRRRIEKNHAKPTLVLTRKGVGYQLT